MNQTYKKGIKLAFITVLISGLANFINKFGVGLWDSAASYTTSKNVLSAILLTGLLIFFKKLPELKILPKKTWGKLILIGIIGGSVPFLLFFKSLTMIPVVEASFIHKTLFLWVALFSYPFLKERLGWLQFSALGVLFCGVFMFGRPSEWSFGAGFLMALSATILWAIENILAKTVLKNVSATTVGWARMFFGSLVLIFYLVATGGTGNIIPSSLPQAAMTFVMGLLLFGYVVSWYSALKYAPATVVSSILVLALPLTAIINSIFVTHAFSPKAFFPAALMLAAILFVSGLAQSFYSKLYLAKDILK